MARCSRRSFLGGVVGALTGWLGRKALPQAQAAPASPPRPARAADANEPSCHVWSANLPAGVTVNANTPTVSAVVDWSGGNILKVS
jgi:hypothetical protein